MILRGVDFGYCWDQSGVRNFFGDGYPYHGYLQPIGLNFEGSTFTAKTTTYNDRSGNMPMKEDRITPREFKPKCIVVDLPGGNALNAVGLSGPGLRWLLEQGRWQKRPWPFILSFMSLGQSRDDRMIELRMFVSDLGRALPRFWAPIALQINFSCPNVKVAHDAEHVAEEVAEALKIASVLGIPLIPKINAVMLVETAAQIAEHSNCDALCVSNTIPWGQLPDKIDWNKLFGSNGVSPLAHLGGGGLSGKLLLPIVVDWVRAARVIGIRKPINAGGGILKPADVNLLAEAGASSVAVGSIAFLRPWRMRATIDRANYLGRAERFYGD